jgi:hypothetical protein
MTDIVTLNAPSGFDTSQPYFLRVDVDTDAGTAVLSVSRTENGPPVWTQSQTIAATGDPVWPVFRINGVVRGPAFSAGAPPSHPAPGAVVSVIAPATSDPDVGSITTYYPRVPLGIVVPGVGDVVTEGRALLALLASPTPWSNNLLIASPCAGTVLSVNPAIAPETVVYAGDTLFTIAYASGGAELASAPLSPEGADLSLLAWRNVAAPTIPPYPFTPQYGSLVAGPGAGGSLRIG